MVVLNTVICLEDDDDDDGCTQYNDLPWRRRWWWWWLWWGQWLLKIMIAIERKLTIEKDNNFDAYFMPAKYDQ